MIAQLTGKIIEKNPTDLVLDVNGVGYELKVSLNTSSEIDEKKPVTIFTQMIVRDMVFTPKKSERCSIIW